MIRNQFYTPFDLAIITPTKNRPLHIQRLLTSIINLDCAVGRIIIVSTGEDLTDIIKPFLKDLNNISYIASEPGQIFQRNRGIELLDESTKLVATLDDDVVLSNDCVSKIIEFLNSAPPDTAGAGFNISNHPSHKSSFLQNLIGLNSPYSGRVLKSGINTAITNIEVSIETQWLNGGATVWKQDILKSYKHFEINSRWAICEDLIYSYPLGKLYPLYVCSDAKISCDLPSHQNSLPIHFQRSLTLVLWHFYFVSQNTDLSKIRFFFFYFIKLIHLIFSSIFYFRLSPIFSSFGLLYGFFLLSFKRKDPLTELIEKYT